MQSNFYEAVIFSYGLKAFLVHIFPFALACIILILETARNIITIPSWKLLPPPSNPDEDGIAAEGSPTTPLAVDQTPENRFQFPEVRSATTTTPRRRVEIAVSYDMQFCTRGNGKKYDSLSAVGSMFGAKSKKCCGFTTMTRKCWGCDAGVPHECEGVFKGSAKAMEPEAAVRMVVRNNDLDEVGVVVKALAGDDDASTMAAIKRVCPHFVEKWHDHNHTQKHVKNDLYKVMSKFSKLFKPTHIPYFVNCYGAAVKQNVGSAEGVRSAILAITPHAFGDHSKCNVSWCGYLQNPLEFRHKYFGNDGSDLTGGALQVELSTLFEKYAVRAEGIAPGASSQRNESANSVFISKAPKRTFTGGTSRYRSQISAAVAQLNKGTQYAGEVFEKLKFSPSSGGQKFRVRMDLARARLAGYKGTPAFKSRRKVLVVKRNSLKSMLENGEGILYESGMGFNQPLPDNVPCGGEVCQVQDTPLPAVSGIKFVFFDTETSGHGEIVQIACKCEGQSGAKFSAYGYPTRGIARTASDVNHLSIIRGELCFNNRPVKSHTSTYKMMNLFFEYLQRLESPAVLVAHNASADLYPLINLCSYYFALPRLAQLVVGVSDTLPLMRAHPVVLHDFSISQANAGEGPDNKKRPAASQGYLAEKYVPGFNSLKAHEALYDCIVLEQLCEYLEVDREYLAKHIKPLSAYVNRVIELDNVRKLLGGLKEDFKSKDISDGTLRKLAEQGLTMRALALKLNNEGPQSFSLFLSKKINNRKNTISAIVDKVTTFLALN